MGTLKLNNVTALTESGGTVVLDSAVTGNTAITGLGTVTTGTFGSGVSFPGDLSQNVTQLYDFSGTIHFDNCGREGFYGPTLTQARSSYSSEYLEGTWRNNTDYFNVIAGLQFFRIPKTGTWTYIVKGAKGGEASYAGLGISLTSTATLYAGEWIKMCCGHVGSWSRTSEGYSGGGGGSFIAVFRMGTWLPLLVAGGGAGFSDNSPNSTNTGRNGFEPGAGKGDALTEGGAGSFYGAYHATDSDHLAHYWSGGGGGGWSAPGGHGTIGANNYSNQPLGGRALGSFSPLGGRWTFYDGAHSGSGGAVPNNGGFGGGGGTGRDGGSAGGGGGWWGGNATFSNSTNSDDNSNLLGGGSHSENAYTSNGTHTDNAGSVNLSL